MLEVAEVSYVCELGGMLFVTGSTSGAIDLPAYSQVSSGLAKVKMIALSEGTRCCQNILTSGSSNKHQDWRSCAEVSTLFGFHIVTPCKVSTLLSGWYRRTFM